MKGFNWLSVVTGFILVGLFFIGYNQIQKDFQDIKGSVQEVRKSINQIQFQIIKIEPDINGHIFKPTIQRFINDQAKQITHGGIVLLGDSITEGLWLNELCGLPVLNAGVGGAGIVWPLNNAGVLLSEAKPRIVFIAIGVNDAQMPKSVSVDEYVLKWTKFYSDLINIIKKSGAKPIISTILPVEKGKPLGEGYFNSQIIHRFNAKLIDLAKAKKTGFCNSFDVFAGPNGYMIPGSTTDGVHLTEQSFEKWRNLIKDHIKSALNKHKQDVSNPNNNCIAEP